MPDVKMKAGKAYLVMQDERRTALEELAAQLRGEGINPDLQIQEYVPGRRGVGFNQPEAVAFYIAGAMSTAILSALANDIYDRVKKWAIARFRAKQEAKPDGLHKPEEFTIYGPDGEVLKHWKIDDDGEHED